VNLQAQAVLDFWFGQPPAAAPRSEWFKKDASFDALIQQRFDPLIENALAGGLLDWLRDGPSGLARILLLDQFTRNSFRGTARAFAGDARALSCAQALVAQGWHLTLSPLQRWFVYLPFEHSEDLAVQREGMHLFDLLAQQHTELADAREWAHKHFVVIQQFGRYPHRNAILGRISTPAELAFLQQPGSSF
jgi:uncharacterized protein (DUF924 family)